MISMAGFSYLMVQQGLSIDTGNHDQQCSDWLAARQQRNDIISLKKSPDEKLDKISGLL